MTSTAIALLIAGVLSMDGEVARIDAGRSAGLRVGDRGVVFYELKVREESRRVEAGEAVVTQVAEGEAKVQVDAGAEVRAGYRVEFSFPVARFTEPRPSPEAEKLEAEVEQLNRRLEASSARIVELEGKAREADERAASLEPQARQATDAAADLERQANDATERAVAAEREAREATARASELERSLAEARSQSAAAVERATAAESLRTHSNSTLDQTHAQLGEALAEQRRLENELSVAKAAADGHIALLTAELETAQASLLESEEASHRAIAPPEVADRTVDPTPAPTSNEEAMERVEAGDYQVGRKAGEASFYNQTPQYVMSLPTFWVDRALVTSAAYEQWRGSAPVTPAARFQIGVTFAEAAAYCRAQGKRLPSEAEWEVAMAEVELEGVVSLLEWTASWYQPYPGNEHPEADYGQRFRVVRVSAGDQWERRYMMPGARDAAVGFRCIRDAGAAP